jgi:hypothetical protein
VRRIVAGIAIFALGVVGSVSTVEEAYAAPATPSPISLNCTDAAALTTSLASINANRVISGAEDDTFVITNVGTGDCTVNTNSGVIRENSTNTITDLTIAPAASRTFDLRDWGTFSVTPAGGTAVSFVSDPCEGLTGSGITAEPWLIGSTADFDRIGSGECSRSGFYRQTADIVIDDYSDRVSSTFAGTYDGDHYTITLTGGWLTYGTGATDKVGLFQTVSGTLKKIRLRGGLHSTGQTVGGLVNVLAPGGLVSEVDVELTMRTKGTGTASFGMVAAQVNESARLQYVRSAGLIVYEADESGNDFLERAIGGLIGDTEKSVGGSAGFAEIRDSYSTVSFQWDNAAPKGRLVLVGGLVGYAGSVTNADDVALRIIRSYASPSFTAVTSTHPSYPTVGGLIGRHDSIYTVAVASFWNSDSQALSAIGSRQPRSGSPSQASGLTDYLTASPYSPEAPGVTSANLRTLSTFQSFELSPVGSGLPGGAEIVEAASGEAVTGDVRAPTAPDYRWAIEQGNKVGFVASDYRAVANFASRKLFDSPVPAASYQIRGVATGEGTVSDYPLLGRVWEICANENNGFPVLVWEERDCAAPGGGGDSGGNPGGLSDAEYAEFLRSGLTLADFLARRLAATGPSDAALGLGGLSAVLFGLAGAALVLIARRQVSRKPK